MQKQRHRENASNLEEQTQGFTQREQNWGQPSKDGTCRRISVGFPYLTGTTQSLNPEDKLLCPKHPDPGPLRFCQGAQELPGAALWNCFCGAALQLQWVTDHWAQYHYTRHKTCLGIVGINHCVLLFQEKKVFFHIKQIHLILSQPQKREYAF